jgi:hypothetical protein
VKFVATKKGMTTNFSPSLLLLFLDTGSGMVKIRIRDKHHGSATLLEIFNQEVGPTVNANSETVQDAIPTSSD